MQKLPAYVGENPEQSLQGVVSMLNEGNPEHPLYSEARSNLVRLIQAWRDSGPNLLKMKYPPGCPTLTESQKSHGVFFGLTEGPRAYVMTAYAPGRKWTPWDLAHQQFIRLVTNPECERFGGPCPRCEKYFIRKTAKQSIYCSRRCASQDTAIKRTVEVRKQQYNHKLSVARLAMAKWEKLSTQRRAGRGWKEYVAKYDPTAEITPKFLTRAVNEGELQAPHFPERTTHETKK